MNDKPMQVIDLFEALRKSLAEAAQAPVIEPAPPRSPFAGSLQFDSEAWHRAGCPTLESAFVAWQAAEERANTAEAELRETAGELEKAREKLARSLELWREWTRTDITEDEDTWSELTNRVHALLEET